MVKEYLKEQFDYESKDVVNTYDELPLWAAPFGQKLLSKIQYLKNMTVLDIGCGAGFPTLEIAQRLGSTSKVYGLDPWKSAIQRANYKMNTYGVKNVKFICGDATKPHFDENTFDLIISNNGINNTGDEKTVIKECLRISKPSGKFIFTVNQPDTMIEFYEIYKKVLIDKGMKDRIEQLDLHIKKHRKSAEEYEKFLIDAGFVVEDIDKDKFEMKFCNGSAMLNYYFIRLCFLEPWIGILDKNDVEGIFTILEDELNNFADKNAGLNLTVPFVCISSFKNKKS